MGVFCPYYPLRNFFYSWSEEIMDALRDQLNRPVVAGIVGLDVGYHNPGGWLSGLGEYAPVEWFGRRPGSTCES
jgi:hypothetical protein